MDYTVILNSLKDYYANLLIVQYNGKPKATATIKVFVDLMLANLIIMQIRDGFDWKTALGAQLDIIGKWVGIDKFYDGQFFYFKSWFSLVDWNSSPDGLQGGFSTFSTFAENDGGFLTYKDMQPTQNRLTAEGFRIMVGLKIIKNSINHTAKNIDDAIWDYFEGKVYTVWGDHTLTYYFPSELNEILQVAEYKNVLPCPTGVRLILKEIIDD